MKLVPLHVVKYFKGEETRTLSKHLHPEAAFQVANRFMQNLKEKQNAASDEQFIVAITKMREGEDQQTLFSLTNRDHGPTGEGVTVTLEAQKNPDWDYPQYTDPR